jgi:hypothetical protein
MRSMLRVVVVLLAALLAACETNTSAPVPPLAATAQVVGPQVRLGNLGRDPWSDVLLTLNREYTYHVATIQPQSSGQVGIRQFTRADGARFNPDTHAPQTLVVQATVNGQRATYTVNW